MPEWVLEHSKSHAPVNAMLSESTYYVYEEKRKRSRPLLGSASRLFISGTFSSLPVKR